MFQHSAGVVIPVISVIGATRHVGSALVAQLGAHPQPVHAMTRRPDAVTVPLVGAAPQPYRRTAAHLKSPPTDSKGGLSWK